MKDMNERELLYAILKNQELMAADLKATKDKVESIDRDLQSLRRETNSNFNRVERYLRFNEVDFDQLNKRVETLEKESKSEH